MFIFIWSRNIEIKVKVLKVKSLKSISIILNIHLEEDSEDKFDMKYLSRMFGRLDWTGRGEWGKGR